MDRYRDPDCTCELELPSHRRIWCDHCLTEGPLPGSLADPNWQEHSAVVAEQGQA